MNDPRFTASWADTRPRHGWLWWTFMLTLGLPVLFLLKFAQGSLWIVTLPGSRRYR